MRELYSSEIEKLLDSQSEFSTKDFFEVMKECPAPTVYSRIRALVTKGILTQIGKGKYAKGKSEAFSFTPGAKAKKIYKELSEALQDILGINAKVIHLEIDPAEINKIVYADVPVLGDVKEALPMIM